MSRLAKCDSGLDLELQRGERQPTEPYRALLDILRAACADEVAHKEDAAKRKMTATATNAGSTATPVQVASPGVSGMLDSLQFSAVYWASRVGAAIAKRV